MTEQAAPYTVEFSKRAEKVLKRLNPPVIKRIRKKLDELAGRAGVGPHYALKGKLSGLFRLRVGDYRVLYWIDHDIRLIKVELIDHRRDVYD